MFGYLVTADGARNDGYCDAADFDDDGCFQKAVLQYEVSLDFDV